MPKALAAALLGVLFASACSSTRPAQPVAAPPPPPDRVTAVTFDPGGETLWVAAERGGQCTVSQVSVATGATVSAEPISPCPSAIVVAAPGRVVVMGNDWSRWIPDRLSSQVLAAAGTERIYAVQGRAVWPDPEGQDHFHDVGDARVLRAFEFAHDGTSVFAIRSSDGHDDIVRMEKGGDPKVIATAPSIDSFALSPDGHDLAFSALRQGGYDVGVVSTDGGEPKWYFPDPGDETMLAWAPRGNKFSFVIHSPAADLLRTVHLLTSAQLTVPFPGTRIHGLAWDPKAEFLAVIVDSPQFSPRVDVIRYAGADRRTVVPSTGTSTLDYQPLAAGALVAPPATARYSERYPVVVWKTSSPLAWSAARARIRAESPQAVVVVTPSLSAEVRDAVTGLAFADPARLVVVSDEPLARSDLAGWPAPLLVVTPGAQAERSRGWIAVPGGADGVESVAAGEIEAVIGQRPEANGQRR